MNVYRFCESESLAFIETSALTSGTGVDDMFRQIITEIYRFVVKRPRAVSDISQNSSRSSDKIVVAPSTKKPIPPSTKKPLVKKKKSPIEFESSQVNFDRQKLDAHWQKVKWVADSACEACTVCNRAFSMFYRRRHCRKCGRIFCRQHCTNLRARPELGYLTPVKNCDLCAGISGSIAQYKSTFMLRQAAKLDPAWRSALAGARDVPTATDYYDIEMNRYLDSNEQLTITERNWKAGDYSMVHAATYRNQPVAVKVYKFWLQANESEVRREVECLRNLRHPNIVMLTLQSEQFDKFPFIMTPLASMGTLHDYLLLGNDVAPLPWVNRYRVLVQVADALNYMHTRLNLLHNDVCSANILVVATTIGQPIYTNGSICNASSAVSSAGTLPLVQLFDFNSTRSTDPNTEWSIWPRVTHTAPEIFRSGGKYSTPAEMYAYCTLISELFGRCHPWVFCNYTKFITEISSAVIDGSLRPQLFCVDNQGYQYIDQFIATITFVNRGWDGAVSLRPTFRDAITTFSKCVSDVIAWDLESAAVSAAAELEVEIMHNEVIEIGVRQAWNESAGVQEGEGRTSKCSNPSVTETNLALPIASDGTGECLQLFPAPETVSNLLVAERENLIGLGTAAAVAVATESSSGCGGDVSPMVRYQSYRWKVGVVPAGLAVGRHRVDPNSHVFSFVDDLCSTGGGAYTLWSIPFNRVSASPC